MNTTSVAITTTTTSQLTEDREVEGYNSSGESSWTKYFSSNDDNGDDGDEDDDDSMASDASTGLILSTSKGMAHAKSNDGGSDADDDNFDDGVEEEEDQKMRFHGWKKGEMRGEAVVARGTRGSAINK